MKKIFYILSAALLLTACNFLDFDESKGQRDRATMYSTYDYVRSMLTNIYGYMPNKDIADVSSALRDCGSDDAEYGDPDASVQRFTNGNWSPLATVDTKWELYSAIRSVSEFLESMETVDLSMYQNQINYQLWLTYMSYFPYEARVLRAYYFFELARRYGDIAMPLTMLSAEEANAIEKTPFDEVIDFIVTECDECIPNLRDTYQGFDKSEVGRVTKGFAMAVKTKALLYAASPLHNPNGDKAKWKKAAEAAKQIMDSGLYELDPEEKANNPESKEVILAIYRSESSSFEKYNFPVRFTEGERTSLAGNFPTQNLVDAFQTAGGYDITLGANGWVTSDPNFDTTHPYEGRDPRFARAILANGMSFKESTIETFVGGQDYSEARSDLKSPTGYYLRRYIQEETSFVQEASSSYKHQWIVYRYAEAVMTYAEAMNEYLGNPTATEGNLNISAMEALNMIRANATMPDVTVTSYKDFQEAVRREWRVEFAFEDHRFWDVRRWKIAQETQGQVDGVKIVKNGAAFNYSRKTVKSRTWADKMYLYPIPQTETFNNPNLTQNTGW